VTTKVRLVRIAAKLDIVNMTAPRFEVSTPASFVADVAKQDTFRKIVKSTLVLKPADMAAVQMDPQEEILIKNIKSSWLKLVEVRVEAVVGMDNRLDVSKVVDLVLGNNLNRSLLLLHHGYPPLHPLPFLSD
jgi:hypothetical protein